MIGSKRVFETIKNRGGKGGYRLGGNFYNTDECFAVWIIFMVQNTINL